MLVDLHEQVDLKRLERSLTGTRLERREQVLAALRKVAGGQRRLRPFLEKARRQGLVRSWQGLVIVNRLVVEATPAGIEALARRPEVAAIIPESELPIPSFAGQGEADPTTPRTSWAVESVGAPDAWRRGLDGRGVIVGVIDSGASALHEQLAPGFRGDPDSWLDPSGGSREPQDNWFGHGTGVLSVAVGRNVSGYSLGIAPAARWIACAALPGGRYNNVLVTRCADWMLQVGRPDVLALAWVLPTEGCDRSLQPLVDAWRAAGILPVFAAGNHGPGERTDRSPANYEEVVSVGGLTPEGDVLPETSRGPGACGGGPFPRLSAPGQDLIAAFPVGRDTYLRARGTSFAAGIAAGAAAILVQSRPEATVPELETALSIGGTGRLDLPAALRRLEQRSARAAEHRGPDQRDRRAAEGQEPVVERAPGGAASP